MRPNLLRYVQAIRAKGSVYLYFRRHGKRWRLPGQPGDPKFSARYLELLGTTDKNPQPRRIGEGSIAAMIRDYRASDEFLGLKSKTQRDYGRMLDIFAPVDRHDADAVRRRHIRELRKGPRWKGAHAKALHPGCVGTLQLRYGQRLLLAEPGGAHEAHWQG
jgi:hypothetical protein